MSRRLSAADASNVVLDAADQVNVFLMAGLLGHGGFVGADGSIDLDALRKAIAARLAEGDDSLQRFSERIVVQGRTLLWERSVPDLTRHVRLETAVDGEAGLAGLCARLMTTPLPRDRPLWEVRIVPGASSGGPGIVVRMHHAVADGVAGVALLQTLFGGQAGPPPPGRGKTVRRRGIRAIVTSALRVAAMLRASVPPTVLLGPIGGRRGVAFADVALDALAGGARRSEGTINDALLAAVAVAVDSALESAGERRLAVLPVSVPVALPDRGDSGNAVGVMRIGLPCEPLATAVRVARIAGLTRAAKAEARTAGTYELTRSRWGARLFARLARRQRFIAAFVTNVKGPAERLRIAGAPLERAWPLTPIQGNVRLGISAWSYAGRLACAVHADASAVPVGVLGAALQTALDEVAGLAPSH